MRFTETAIDGAFLIEPERRQDDRGFFARTWCRREFEAFGLDTELAQCSLSFNHRAGTLRGLHFQKPPHDEVKLVRCTAGAICDVLLDLRRHSPTILRWIVVDLTAGNHHALYVPPGVAHGFQTLMDNSVVFYQISEFYHPESASGVRWNDPAFGIRWPLPAPILSERDASYPDFQL